MSESFATQDSGVPEHGASAMTAGGLIRQLRESAGMHIDALAATLKVPVVKLQALEDDHYEAFPDAVFMRALASSICRSLKVDAAPVLALLPQGAPIQLPPDRGLNTAFKDSGRRPGKGSGSLEQPKSRLVVLAVVALLLAALAVAFLPMPIGDGGADGGNTVAETTVPAVPVPPVIPPEPQAAPGEAATAQAAPGAAPAAAHAPGTGAPMALDLAMTGAGQPAAETAEQVLVIRARAPSWVQVRNAAGRVVLQKSLAAGETYTAEGNAPWHVVIGRADATEVIVRGQAMDLKAMARDNVARFEVK